MINHWNDIHEASFDVNQFTDKDPSQNKIGFVPSKLRSNKALKVKLNKKLLRNAPTTLDYRALGLVTKVKDQGDCSSCYIFGAVGNIESQYAKLTGELISLSEQQTLDCAGNPCDEGGDELQVLRLLSMGHGLMSEADYPYGKNKQKQGKCIIKKRKVKVKVTSGCYIHTPDEQTLKEALLEYGPLAISLYVSPSMDHYSGGGVFKPKDCPYKKYPNHVALLVVYSADSNGTPYWIIKNSYGQGWGHEGYLYLEMGKGHCSILKEGAVIVKVMRP